MKQSSNQPPLKRKIDWQVAALRRHEEIVEERLGTRGATHPSATCQNPCTASLGNLTDVEIH